MSNLPSEVTAAVEHLNADPAVPYDNLQAGSLLDFAVYPDRVSVVIFTGQKYTISLDALKKRLAKVVGGKSKPPENTLKQ